MKTTLGIVLLLLITLSAPTFALQRYAIFPEFASGAGWTSELFFTNQDIAAVAGIKVSFYDKKGVSLSVESNLGVGPSFVFTLNPGATRFIKVTPFDTLAEGYVVVTYPSTGSPVRATQVYRYEQGGTVQVEVGVPQQELGDHFSFPVEVDSSQRIYTAVAFCNPTIVGSTAQTLIVNLINPDGSIRATATVPMQPGQHLAGYLNQDWLFPGLDNFIGSISISSAFGAGILALRQDKEAFGAISTDGGPVLGPFALSGTAIQEKEPNDTPKEAQSISGSTIINGTIDPAGDLDAFQITGKAGDIISVICDTQGTGSNLDSVLKVFDSDLNIIAQNDQNGLSPQGYPISDSFIQVVLPADGKYYVTVTDYYEGGGSSYTYTLHVKLP